MVLSVWKELTELGESFVEIQIFRIWMKKGIQTHFNLLLEILVSMSSFEKSMIDMRRTEGIERTKKLELKVEER